MSRVKITLTINVPEGVEATEEQTKEWVLDGVYLQQDLGNNPLKKYGLLPPLEGQESVEIEVIK